MNDQDDIKNLEKELSELKVDIRVAKNTLKASISVIAIILFIFFGITYSKLDSIVYKAVEKFIEIKAVAQVTENAKQISEDSIRKSQLAALDAEQVSSKASEKIQASQKQIIEEVQQTLQTLNRLDEYENTAEQRVKEIENSLAHIQKLIPELENLSLAGVAKHGEVVSVPWGTISDWNIMLSPKFIGTGKSIETKDTVLISAYFYARPQSSNSWKITAQSRHSFGVDIKNFSGEVNYLLVPKGGRGQSQRL